MRPDSGDEPEMAWRNFAAITMPNETEIPKKGSVMTNTEESLSDEEQDERNDQSKKRLQMHPHHVLDDEKDEYWTNLIEYLETLKIPKNIRNRKSFIQTTQKYFIQNNALWRRTRDLPRKVILNNDTREDLIRKVHDESGHRGRDPTYRKLSDFYFWPNMLAKIALYCRTCNRCQLRSTYHPKVMINPTWVPTILRKFNLDLHSMEIMLYKASIAITAWRYCYTRTV
jgi:hypothetical protein